MERSPFLRPAEDYLQLHPYLYSPARRDNHRQGGFFNAAPTPEMPVLAIPDDEYTVSLSSNRRYEFAVDLEQPLFTWGQIRRGVSAARWGWEAASQELFRQEQELQGKALALLHSLDLLEEMTGWAARQVETARRLAALGEENHQNGFLPREQLLLIRLGVEEALLLEANLRQQQNRALLSLKSLTGLEGLSLDMLHLPPRPTTPHPSPSAGADLIDKALASYPGLEAQRSIMKSRQGTAESLRGGSLFKPHLGLYMEVTYIGSRFPLVEEEWLDANRPNFQATLGLRTPLFDGGANGSSVSQAEQQAAAAALNTRRMEMELKEEIPRLLGDAELLYVRETYHRRTAEVHRERGIVMKERWESGYGGEDDWLEENIREAAENIKALEALGERIRIGITLRILTDTSLLDY